MLLAPSILILASASIARGAPQDDASPELWGALEPGPAAVGLRVLDLDVPETAPNPPEAFRHGLRLFVWYPAQADGEGERMTLADAYVLQEENAPGRAELAAWFREDTGLAAQDEVDVDAWLDASLRARVDALPLAGRHATVFWSARHGVPVAQSVLCEYLASHGFVVAWAWPLGPTPAMPWESRPREVLEGTLGEHVELLSRALDHVLELEQVDAERVACVAWSYGGESATLLAQRRDELAGVVSLSATTLDAFFGSAPPGAGDLPARMVYVMETRSEAGGAPRGWNALLERAPGPCVGVRFEALHHNDFNFAAGYLAARLGARGHARWSAGGEVAIRGYETLAPCVRSAVGYVLDPEPGFDTAWMDGLPEDFAAVEDFGREPGDE